MQDSHFKVLFLWAKLFKIFPLYFCGFVMTLTVHFKVLLLWVTLFKFFPLIFVVLLWFQLLSCCNFFTLEFFFFFTLSDLLCFQLSRCCNFFHFRVFTLLDLLWFQLLRCCKSFFSQVKRLAFKRVLFSLRILRGLFLYINAMGDLFTHFCSGAS